MQAVPSIPSLSKYHYHCKKPSFYPYKIVINTKLTAFKNYFENFRNIPTLQNFKDKHVSKVI